jgi:putative transposase
MEMIIEKNCYDYDIDLEELELPDDYIHVIIITEPKRSPSDIMQIVKSISAREFFKRYSDIRKKYFWGGKLWTQSYFVETAGNVNEKIIREYVKNQLAAIDKKEHKIQQSLF